jgi:dihydrofolate synthase/folylpolyglutamate synthase
LGNTLQEIAREKAGIIKNEVPVIIGEKKEETENIFSAIATEKNAPLSFAENIFDVERVQLDTIHLKVAVKNIASKKIIDLLLDLPGSYQAKNIITVLASVEVLKQKGWLVTDEIVYEALQNVKKLTGLHGRWEVLQVKPMVVLEVAHNEAGIRQMLRHIEQLNYNKLHLIFGMVKDKEPDKILSMLPKDASYYFSHSHIPRAMNAIYLQEQAKSFGINGSVFEDVNLALKNALDKASADDLIIVCGSIFLVAEVNSQ